MLQSFDLFLDFALYVFWHGPRHLCHALQERGRDLETFHVCKLDNNSPFAREGCASSTGVERSLYSRTSSASPAQGFKGSTQDKGLISLSQIGAFLGGNTLFHYETDAGATSRGNH